MSVPYSKHRILCLHGMGSNARIFEMQTRQLRRLLDPHFDFVFINATVPSEPGPEVLPFFDGCGPFFRWTFSENDEQDRTLLDLHRLIDDSAAKDQPFVAVMGFSEGASIATSLILDQQERRRRRHGYDLKNFMESDTDRLPSHADFRFAILFCAANNPPFLHRDHKFFVSDPKLSRIDSRPEIMDHRVTVPSLHVLGLLDSRLAEGRSLLRLFYSDPISTVIEWEGGHQLPTSPKDVAHLAILILRQYNS